MGQLTTIPWANYTSNPIRAERKDNGRRGHACIKVSEECDHCYAEEINLKWGTGLPFDKPSMSLVEPYLNEKELHWLATSKVISGKAVFVEDMADLFGPWVRLEWLEQLFDVFSQRQDVTFQLLTKWPQRLVKFVMDEKHVTPQMTAFTERIYRLQNVWLGTTVGTQHRADQRIEPMRTLAAHGWLTYVSSEPRLEPINWKAGSSCHG